MIVDLTADRLEDCARLFVRTFSAPPWNEEWTRGDAAQRLGDMLATPRSVGSVAVADGGDVIGFVLGHRERAGTEDHLLVQEMCVAAAHQREGWGSRLLAALEHRLPDVQHWYLLTLRDGAAAAFYEAHEFRPASRVGVYVRP
ncbi:GNAT family N-acetyltransferase [Isoptericola sp. NPDC019571]|uniref:GNAT family N-acetyltransferase n=1 Tax=Isoptericola sp. NPDC019571 TaxID=3364008 RepID=UPI0037AFEC78